MTLAISSLVNIAGGIHFPQPVIAAYSAMFLLSRAIVGVRLSAKMVKLNYMQVYARFFAGGVEFQAECPDFGISINAILTVYANSALADG